MIEAEDIYKYYGHSGMQVDALLGVSLRVSPGEFVAIVGPSGAGKSTLIHILGCLERPNSGRYALAGCDTGVLSSRALAHLRNRVIGFVFQAFQLLPSLTAAENVELPLIYAHMHARKRRERVNALLEALELGDRATHLPSELSGGQRQRVAIARALANEPQLLLADEPTGSLDSRTGEEIMRLLRGRCENGTALLLITHDRNVARMADRMLTLKNGKLEMEND